MDSGSQVPHEKKNLACFPPLFIRIWKKEECVKNSCWKEHTFFPNLCNLRPSPCTDDRISLLPKHPFPKINKLMKQQSATGSCASETAAAAMCLKFHGLFGHILIRCLLILKLMCLSTSCSGEKYF